jgi:hypothetical protein
MPAAGDPPARRAVRDVWDELARDAFARVLDDELGPAVRPHRPPTRPPCGVNLIAFDNRFHTICWSRSASPRTAIGRSGSDAVRKMRFASAAGCTTSTAARVIATRSTGRKSKRHSPATMRDMSSRSSISRAWAYALRRIELTARAVRVVPRFPAWSMFAQARIGVSGVRSSCETVAKNASFARLASSSRMRAASVRSSDRSCSIASCGAR